MAFFDELSRRMNQSMDIGKLQASANAEDKYIRQAKEQIGDLYLKAHRDDEAFEPYVADLMQGILDAEKRRDEYQSLIRKTKGITLCPNCGGEVNPGVLFCTRCGARQTQNEQQAGGFCSQCGQPIRPGAKFCQNCGAPVTPPEAEKETAQEEEQSESGENEA